MALKNRELYAGPTNLAQQPRLKATSLIVARFAADAGARLLPIGTPVAQRISDDLWVPLAQASDAAIYTLTANATAASAGSFELQIDGLGISLAFDVAAAALQTAVNAMLLDAGKPYTVAAVATTGTDLGDNSAVITITFSENAGAPSVSVDMGNITGNDHALAASDAGTQLDGTNLIRGFVYEQAVQLDATDDVLDVVMVRGEAYEADVNTAAIRAVLDGSPSDGEVQAALKDDALNQKILIRGLPGAN
jgi:hypothetical protein